MGRLALLHPFPSALNAVLVAALATLAGADVPTAAALAGGMFGFQVSIGALNDLVDVAEDRVAKPAKPLPDELVSTRVARAVVVGGAAIGVALSALVSPVALVIGLAGYGCGVAYDLWLKRRGLGWVGFSAGFPLLLLYAWTGAGGGLPPGWPTLLPVAALAGAALQLANALTDLEHDRSTGVDGLAVRLGRPRATALLVILVAAVHSLAWLTLLAAAPEPVAVVGAVAASGVAAVGLGGSASGTPRGTAWGWTLQAAAIALLAVAWVATAAG